MYPEEIPISTTRVCDLKDDDKPREKALHHGISSLSDAELIAIVLGSGIPGKSVIDLSREMLKANDFRLSRLQRMSIHELTRNFQGIGPAKAISLAAAFELGKRYEKDLRMQDIQVKDSNVVYDYLRGDIENLPYETFIVVHLNRANRIIFVDTVSRGGTSATVVDVKVVMKCAVDKMASGLILVHNHPSGGLLPSTEDDRLTERIRKAAELLDIRVLDHLIISSQGYYSYADKGRL